MIHGISHDLPRELYHARDTVKDSLGAAYELHMFEIGAVIFALAEEHRETLFAAGVRLAQQYSDAGCRGCAVATIAATVELIEPSGVRQ